MQKAIAYALLVFLINLAASASVNAQGTKTYRSPDEVTLPSLEHRKILGTWITASLSGLCTRSFEVVARKVYQVLRCDDGSGGKTGQLISQVSPIKFLKRHSSAGDHYVITESGDLSVRDNEGEIDIEPRTSSLWPTKQDAAIRTPRVEDTKTVGLKCYDVGYRYGFTATSSLKGKKINSSWDFAVPDRCQGDQQTDRGIEAGTRAAW